MMQKLNGEMDIALAGGPSPLRTVKMLPTYVTAVPDGTETGNYLALDLGGTNFRVLLITLHGVHFVMTSEVFEVPKDIMVGEGVKVSTLLFYAFSCIR